MPKKRDRRDNAMDDSGTGSISPTIVLLRARLERLRKAEIARFRSKLGRLNASQENALDELTRGIIRRICAPSIAAIRASTETHEPAVVEYVRSAFHLEE